MKNINDLLDNYKPDNFFVLQIGAHDGITADPISSKVKENGWSGLFVEPVDYLFERLKLNYKGYDNLNFENSIISNKKGYVDFYEYPQESENDNEFPYGSCMGSVLKPFDSIAHKKLKYDVIKKQYQSLTFNDLIEKYNIKNIDLLQIDTEGYDGEIICSIDFNKVRPKFIRYEDRHTDIVYNKKLTKVSSNDVVSYLNENNYTVGDIENGYDRVCVCNSIFKNVI